MRSILLGLAAGIVVFLLLLAIFASGTGPVELLLWLVLSVAAGVLVTRADRRRTRSEP